jgi:hypothetical protein
VNLKGQHIGGLFSFLAGLVVLAHAVVPHHHNFELTHSSDQESSCEIPLQGNSSETPDSHCHALNILASEKSTNTSLNHSLSDYFIFYPDGINSNIELPPVNNLTETIFDHQVNFLKQFFFSAHSLRAPPVYA